MDLVDNSDKNKRGFAYVLPEIEIKMENPVVKACLIGRYTLFYCYEYRYNTDKENSK